MEFEFDLENPIESLSNVPEDLHDFYEQSDDGYRVSEAKAPVAKRLNGLQKNLKSERSKRTEAGRDAGKARETAKAYAALFEEDGLEEINPENVQEHLKDLRARAAKGGKDGKDAAAEIERIKGEMKSAHARELASKDEAIANKDKQINKLVVGSQITDALAKHEAVGGEILKTYLEKHVRVQTGEDGVPRAIVIGDDEEIRYNGEGNPMGVDEFVASLKSKEDFAPFFKSTKTAGSGTPTEGARNQQQRQSRQRQEPTTPAGRISQGLAKRKASGAWQGRK